MRAILSASTRTDCAWSPQWVVRTAGTWGNAPLPGVVACGLERASADEESGGILYVDDGGKRLVLTCSPTEVVGRSAASRRRGILGERNRPQSRVDTQRQPLPRSVQSGPDRRVRPWRERAFTFIYDSRMQLPVDT